MNKVILLIEDNKDIRESTLEILALADYEVIEADNGKKGVELALQHRPDLIICDIMMPELDGYGVLFALSKNEKTASIPFIFLTAKAERNDMRKGMEMGADDYLTKPFDDVELLNAIESRFRKNELLKREFAKNSEGYVEFVHDVRGIEQLKQLSTEKKIRHYKKRQNIYLEGDSPYYLYLVNKGKIKTYLMNNDGKEMITGLYNEGDFFGYADLLQEQNHSDTAQAMEETEVLLIPKEDFYSLIYRNSEVSKKFIKMLTNNLKEKEEQLISIAYNSVRKRVADALLLLKKRYDKETVPHFTINILREDLANMVGTATETISRTLSDFKDEKLIDIRASNITLLDIKHLESMKN